MKKIVVLVIAAVMAAGMMACNASKTKEEPAVPTEVATEVAAEIPTEVPSEHEWHFEGSKLVSPGGEMYEAFSEGTVIGTSKDESRAYLLNSDGILFSVDKNGVEMLDYVNNIVEWYESSFHIWLLNWEGEAYMISRKGDNAEPEFFCDDAISLCRRGDETEGVILAPEDPRGNMAIDGDGDDEADNVFGPWPIWLAGGNI